MTVDGTHTVTIAIIGAGQRGTNYAEYALREPAACKIVAVAEPRPKTRRRMVDAHAIDEKLVFEDWRELLKVSTDALETLGTKLCDAVIVAVQDAMHCEVTTAFAAQGYHILCEKPMATSIEDCIRMHDVVKKAGVIFGCGHVLRYSPYNKDMSAIIQSGKFGDLINAVHVEPVGHWHFAHSFVRGNWRNEKESSFSLMTKSCQYTRVL
jgi:predicted dehydrogenase